jgi:sugar/nucleoside kinase (ribokinase family)
MADPVDVIVSGHLCLDLIPEMNNVPLQRLATPGRLIETGPLSTSTGGVVSNTGLALHRLGVNVRLMATVGDDLIGQAIIAHVSARSPELGQSLVIQRGQAGSYTIVLSPKGTDRTFLHCTGTNATFGLANIDFSLLARAKIFHLGYPPFLAQLMKDDGAELKTIYQRAKETGAVTSLDLALPDPNGISGGLDWTTILRGTLPYVDIFLPSIEEILFMLRRRDYDAWQENTLSYLSGPYLCELADELLSMGAVIVGFKLGEMGMYLHTSGSPGLQRLQRLPLDSATWTNVELWQPAFQVEVAGTTGAGDSAYAGFLTALLRGLNPLEAIRMACAIGACNVEAVDATSGVRTWEETQSRLAAGWPTRPERLPGL